MSTVLGIDVGTSGVRVLAVCDSGTVLASAESPLHSYRSSDRRAHEQDPWSWWEAVCNALKQVGETLSVARCLGSVSAVGVTSTSGSLVIADHTGNPLRNAIMYDDSRAAEFAGGLRTEETPEINSSYSLAKAVWVRQFEPHLWDRTRYLLHPADWIAGKLSGRYGISDYCNALKLGYDPHAARWSAATRRAGLADELLPEVLGPGEIAGSVCAVPSEESGLPVGLPIALGATDGMADLVASGAQRATDTNTTLGTTMVWKVLSTQQPRLSGSVYCHRHPGGWLAPGAASNTGPGSVRWSGSASDRWAADLRASERFPTSLLCYPLRVMGERFPFQSEWASGFQDGEPATYWDGYAAQLEALAYIERWGYERIASCGVETGGTVYSGGAAARSQPLARVRSSVLRRPVCRTEHPSAAFGAAILAAAGSLHGGDLRAAISRMTHLAKVEEPCAELSRRYEDLYGEFRAACTRRGYV